MKPPADCTLEELAAHEDVEAAFRWLVANRGLYALEDPGGLQKALAALAA